MVTEAKFKDAMALARARKRHYQAAAERYNEAVDAHINLVELVPDLAEAIFEALPPLRGIEEPDRVNIKDALIDVLLVYIRDDDDSVPPTLRRGRHVRQSARSLSEIIDDILPTTIPAGDFDALLEVFNNLLDALNDISIDVPNVLIAQGTGPRLKD